MFSINNEKNTLEKELLAKKMYISKLESKVTTKPGFSTRRDYQGVIEKEARSEEIAGLEQELKRKIKQLEKIALESEEKLKEDRKFNAKEILRVFFLIELLSNLSL